MRVSPCKFLAVAIAVALPVVYCRRTPGPDGPAEPPVSEALTAPPPETALLRLAAKLQLAREVADGRRTLWEAAALFRELDRLPPPPIELSRLDGVDQSLPIAGRTEAERYCRHVVAQVRAALRDDLGRVAAAAARLEAEFVAELRAHGAIRLPDPASLEPVEELLQQARAWIAEHEQRTGSGPLQR
jgi:hypothetical protein